MLPVILFGSADLLLPLEESWTPPAAYKICQTMSDQLRLELLKPDAQQEQGVIKAKFNALLLFMQGIPGIQENTFFCAECVAVVYKTKVYEIKKNVLQYVLQNAPYSELICNAANLFAVCRILQCTLGGGYVKSLAILPYNDYLAITATSLALKEVLKDECLHPHINTFFVAGSMLCYGNEELKYIQKWNDYLEYK